MANKAHKKQGVLMGVNSLVFALLTDDTAEGATYGEDIYSVPGTIEIGLTPNTSDEPLSADDNPTWEVQSSLDSYDVALNLASIGSATESMLLGRTIDANGVVVAGTKDNPPWVAMGFKAPRTGDEVDYIWLYKGKFKPSDETYHTKEKGTVNWNTPNISGTFGPRDCDGKIIARLRSADEAVSEATKAGFFATVYEPAAEAVTP